MKRILGAKTCAGVMLHTGLALAMCFLCFGDAAEGRDRGKGKDKDKEKSVLVSKPKAKKAEETKEKEEEENIAVVSRKVKGEVSGIAPTFIMVTYNKETKSGKKTEYDICLTIGEDLEMGNADELSAIKVGYTVSVQYEEKRRTYERKLEDGTVKQATRIAGREAKKITFLDYGSKTKGVLTSE